ncbi:MAG: YARHG domain-containing protein [Ignavibacteriae bacterium]|nr:MAG: YARHG domain-containing protein [Ignavibacteriota bacterium]
MIGKIISNYKIISSIGVGGMGSVYLAQHNKLDRNVAVKVLNPELSSNEEIRKRFINEANTLSKLNHHNIVTLYDFADEENNLFLIMEYVEGTPLDTVIEKVTGPIPEVRCNAIFDQILSGFAYAHKKGIVHRDIKPSNIILQSDDTPKILDFGIAKIVEGDLKLTKTGTRMGSVIYMSPEQVMGREVDLRSDIYSLGVTLFEMLSGKLPYDSGTESEFEIQTKIVREPLPSIRAVNPNVSEKLDQIICRATAKEPGYRFSNCEEFKNALASGTARAATGTVIQTINQPVSNKTVYNAPPSDGYYPDASIPQKKKINPLVFIIPAAVVVLVIAAIFLFKNGDEKTTVEIKSSTTNSGQTKTSGNYKFNIEGKYTGNINGSSWDLYISGYDGKNFRGYNTIYWPGKVVSANFTGNYDQSTGVISMFEESGKGAGRFDGQFSTDGKTMSGDWHRYSDNGSYSWYLTKSEGSYSQDRSTSTPGKYPEATDRLLASDDVRNLSKWELKIMRNEIFARHGYIFKTDDMRDYFNRQSWYSGTYDNVESMLSSTEKSNIELIKRYE